MSKLCCLCGREGHSANACPWRGKHIHAGLISMASTAINAYLQTIEHSIDKAKIAEAIQGIKNTSKVLEDLAN